MCGGSSSSSSTEAPESPVNADRIPSCWDRLPGDVQKKILAPLLISEVPIRLGAGQLRRRRGIQTSLLHVSKDFGRQAASVLYTHNMFRFTDANNAWMHLEMFLFTIGPMNCNHIQDLSLPAP